MPVIQPIMSLVFIDSTVADYQQLLEGLLPGTEAILLDPQRDGVAQITEVLAQRQSISSVHIVSHGSPGSLQLGATSLNGGSVDRYQSQLQQWRSAFTADADILLYGCDVASDASGQEFVRSLSQLTGADVAASDDLTGSAKRGGDWELEVKTGTIEAPIAFSTEVIANYQSILPGIAGLKGEYFQSASPGEFTTLKLTRTDTAVNFNWGSGSPDPLLPKDLFAVRWTGKIEAATTGSYAFRATSDDGVRLWVNNNLLINAWNDHAPTSYTNSIFLTAGQQYNIKMEYYENIGGAFASLEWIPPSPGSFQPISSTELVVNVDIAATGNLSVTGAAAEGGRLIAALTNVVDADGPTSTAYRWQEDISGTWTNIASANTDTLSIPGDQSYVGKSVRVVATTTDPLFGRTTFTSETKVIANVKDDSDFNGDGQADILLANAGGGWSGIWTMNGTTPVGWTPLPNTYGALPMGAGDFNGDGKDDILLANAAGGWSGIWTMDGTTPVGWTPLPNTYGALPMGAGDFNGDGKDDILLANAAGGWSGIWTMDGTTPVGWTPLPNTYGALPV